MLSDKPDDVIQVYKKRTLHYINYLGLPIKLHDRQLRTDTALGILEFKPRQGHPFSTWATSGMSELWQSTPVRETLFTELVFYAKKSEPWIVGLLEKLAAYPFEQQTIFAAGQTLPMQGPIVPRSRLTSLVLLDPLLELNGFGVIETVAVKRIQVLWVLAITEAEKQFIMAHGAAEFCKRIDTRKPAAITDFQRASLV